MSKLNDKIAAARAKSSEQLRKDHVALLRREHEMKLILRRIVYMDGWAGDRARAIVKRAVRFLKQYPIIGSNGKPCRLLTWRGWEY